MSTNELVLSQGSLQDFVYCRMRFQLKYVRQQIWPAVSVEPALEHEVNSLKGQQFHSYVERYYLLREYLSSDEVQQLIGSAIADPEVARWWNAYLAEPPLNLPEEVVVPEARVSIDFAGHRLVGVFDLLAVEPEQRVVIVDWKTARRRPTREVLSDALQTRVYPILAVHGLGSYFGGYVDPARITMVYWYANYPGEPHVYHYSDAQYKVDYAFVRQLLMDVSLVIGQADVLAEMTLDEKHCHYCGFRSFCDRGVLPGVGDLGGDFDFVDLDDGDELVY